MKRIITIMLLALAAFAAQAQQMEKAIIDFVEKYGDEYITSQVIETWTLADSVSTGYQYHYFFTLPLDKFNELDPVLKAYKEDSAVAYHIFHKKAGQDIGFTQVMYGEGNSKWWKIGMLIDRDFRTLLIRDKKNPNHRLCCDVEWYSQDGMIKGEFFRIFGDDPQRVVAKTNEKNDDTNVVYDDGAVRVRATGNNVVVGMSDALQSLSIDSIKTADGYIEYFSNLRTVYIKLSAKGGDGDESEDMSLSLQTAIVNRMKRLYTKAGNLLTSEEKNICYEGLNGMISATTDNYLKSLLQALQKRYRCS